MDDSFVNDWQRALGGPGAAAEPGLVAASGAPSAPRAVRQTHFGGTKTVLDLVRDALDHKRGLMAYQPVFASRHLTAPAFFEGLTRIYTKEGKLIPAREFIHEVDCSVIGREIDCLSLELSMQALREHPDLRLSVNLSARSIAYPRWNRILDHWLKADPYLGERLIFEISESSAMVLPELVSVFMRERQADGIAFALDYFGSGGMSLRHMMQFSFDIVKIDGTFVRNIAQDVNNQTVLKALTFLAQNFDMLTVAVSVENEADAQYLRDVDLDYLQGFYLGAPSVNPAWLNKDAAATRG